MSTLLTGLTATIGVGSIGMIITCLSVRDIDLETPVDGTSPGPGQHAERMKAIANQA